MKINEVPYPSVCLVTYIDGAEMEVTKIDEIHNVYCDIGGLCSVRGKNFDFQTDFIVQDYELTGTPPSLLEKMIIMVNFIVEKAQKVF